MFRFWHRKVSNSCSQKRDKCPEHEIYQKYKRIKTLNLKLWSSKSIYFDNIAVYYLIPFFLFGFDCEQLDLECQRRMMSKKFERKIKQKQQKWRWMDIFNKKNFTQKICHWNYILCKMKFFIISKLPWEQEKKCDNLLSSILKFTSDLTAPAVCAPVLNFIVKLHFFIILNMHL